MGFIKFSIFAVLFVSSYAQANLKSGTCLAIRGNGELQPAHWGGLARFVETFGEPAAVAGGSSAAITAFWVEALATNPIISDLSPKEKVEALSLMWKSLEGLASPIVNSDELKQILSFLSQASQKSDLEQSIQVIIAKYRDPNNFSQVVAAIDKIKKTKIFYGPAVENVDNQYQILANNPNNSQANMALWMAIEQLKAAIQVFGKYDAANDLELFVRPGIINFKALAEAASKVGDFLSMNEATASAANSIKRYLSRCAHVALGKTWSQFTKKNPECPQLLQDSWAAYVQSPPKRTLGKNSVGRKFPSVVTTAVVTGAAGLRMKMPQLSSMKDLNLDSDSVKFGYWSDSLALSKIQTNLPKLGYDKLDKSQRFMRLPKSSWLEVMSVSPAEPGLSSAVWIPHTISLQASVGGWSDLHPVPVLKSLGCEKVVYLTRRGGESIFAMGVAKRLLSFHNVPWEELDPANKEKANQRKNIGVKADQTSLWSKMFNVENPNSSISGSIAAADNVICTNWDDYDIKTDFSKMIEDAYNSPITNLNIHPKDNVVNADGSRKYVGCMPNP